MKALKPTPLERFFGPYFHQDYALFYASADEALTAALAEVSTSDLVDALGELRACLNAGLVEAQLGDVLLNVEVYYDPESDGLTFGRWLAAVEQQMTSTLEDRRRAT